MSKRSPDTSAVPIVNTGTHNDYTYNVSPEIVQAKDIIKKYTLCLSNVIIPTENPIEKIETANLKFKTDYTEYKPFFEFIHNIIRENTSISDINNAQKIIEQFKILIAPINSLLSLNQIINDKNNKNNQENTLPPANLSEDLELKSVSTYTDAFTPQAINQSIASTTTTPATVSTVSNKEVTSSVMMIPELKKEIKEKLQTIIKKGFFVVGGNIQCSNEHAFTNSDFTHMHFLKVNPFDGKTNLITAPLTPEKLSKLTDTICNPSPKHIYIVGNLYCVDGKLIPPNLDNIIGMYTEEPSETLENNEITKLLTDDKVNIPDIRIKLQIDNFCLSLEDVDNTDVAAKTDKRLHSPTRIPRQPNQLRLLQSQDDSATRIPRQPNQLRLLQSQDDSVVSKNVAPRNQSLFSQYDSVLPTRRKAWKKGGGNKYTRKNHLVTNNSKTRKNYYDEYGSDDKSDSEANESIHE